MTSGEACGAVDCVETVVGATISTAAMRMENTREPMWRHDTARAVVGSSFRARGAAVLTAIVVAAVVLSAQTPIDTFELADYRLTPAVFERFVRANTRIVEIARTDPIFTFAPLFSKTVMLSGDAVIAASGLAARLENHAGLSAALDEAKLTPREYAKFAISLVGAHLAYNFLKTGALRRVPEGAPTINVEFVKAHETEVATALESLGIRD